MEGNLWLWGETSGWEGTQRSTQSLALDAARSHPAATVPAQRSILPVPRVEQGWHGGVQQGKDSQLRVRVGTCGVPSHQRTG